MNTWREGKLGEKAIKGRKWKKGKLGAYIMKREAAGFHLPTSWLSLPKENQDSNEIRTRDLCARCQTLVAPHWLDGGMPEKNYFFETEFFCRIVESRLLTTLQKFVKAMGWLHNLRTADLIFAREASSRFLMGENTSYGSTTENKELKNENRHDESKLKNGIIFCNFEHEITFFHRNVFPSHFETNVLFVLRTCCMQRLFKSISNISVLIVESKTNE